MASKSEHTHATAPTILLHTNKATPAVKDAMIEQADAYGWQLLDLDVVRGIIPTDPAPVGAIVSDLPDSTIRPRYITAILSVK